MKQTGDLNSPLFLGLSMATESIYNVKTIKKFLADIQTNVRSYIPSVVMNCEVGQIKEYQWAVYLTFKDRSGTVNGMIYRRNYHTGLTVGDRVNLAGEIKINRGQVTVVPTRYVIEGVGDEFNRMKKIIEQLDKKGYFDKKKKRLIGNGYRKIGLITSIKAAGFKDMVDTFRRRMVYGQLYLYPTLVQGDYAPAQIAAAIRQANTDQRTELLVVARGGGSKHDLACFNDPIVADEIYRSKIPVVTGIGHQIDESIADLVADKSFITPTAAAEGVTMDKLILINQLNQLEQRVQQLMGDRIIERMGHLRLTQQQVQDCIRRVFVTYRESMEGLKRGCHERIVNACREKQRQFDRSKVVLSTRRINDLSNTRLRLEQLKKQVGMMIKERIHAVKGQVDRLETGCKGFNQSLRDGRVHLTDSDGNCISTKKRLRDVIETDEPVVVSLTDGDVMVKITILEPTD